MFWLSQWGCRFIVRNGYQLMQVEYYDKTRLKKKEGGLGLEK